MGDSVIENVANFANKTPNCCTCTCEDLTKYDALMVFLPFYKQKSSNILLLQHILFSNSI